MLLGAFLFGLQLKKIKKEKERKNTERMPTENSSVAYYSVNK